MSKLGNIPRWWVMAVILAGLTMGIRTGVNEAATPDVTIQGPLLGLTTAPATARSDEISQEEQAELIREALANQWHSVPDLENHRPDAQQVTAENGLIAYVGTDGHLYLINQEGTAQISLVNDLENLANPVWSLDETHLAFVGDGGNGRCLYKLRLSDRQQNTLVCGLFALWEPRWSPDGNHITYWGHETSDDPTLAWVVTADGSAITPLAPQLLTAITPDWIDNSTVVLAGQGSTDVWYIYRLNIVQPEQTTPLTPAINPDCIGSFAAYPVLSPDEQYIAYIGAWSEGGKNSSTCYYAIYLVDPTGLTTPSKKADVADTTQASNASVGTMQWAADNQRLGLLASGSDNILRLTIVNTNDGSVNILEGQQGAWNGWDWSPDDTLIVAGHVPTDGDPTVYKVTPAPGTFEPLVSGDAPAWSSLPLPPPVDLEATGIEVTQAIQRFNLQDPNNLTNNNVPVVLGRETVVRVFPRLVNQGAGQLFPISARVWVILPDDSIVEGQLISDPILPQTNPQRRQEEHGLNFTLPLSETIVLPVDPSEQTIMVYAEVNHDLRVYEVNRDNNTTSVNLDITAPRTLALIGVPVQYQSGEQIITAPSMADIQSAAIRVSEMYPISQMSMEPYQNAENPVTMSCNLEYLSCWSTSALEIAKAISLDDSFRDKLNDLQALKPRVFAMLPDQEVYWKGYGDGTAAAAIPIALGRNLNDGTGDEAGNLMAHELAHTYGWGHPEANVPAYPISEIGFNVARKEIVDFTQADPPHTHPSNDINSYQFSTMWISPSATEHLLSRLHIPEAVAQATVELRGPQLELLVTGILSDDNFVSLDEFYVVEQSQHPVQVGVNGDYAIELRDENDTLLLVHHFDVDFELAFGDGSDNGQHAPAIVREWVPFDPLTANIVLRHGNDILADRQLSDQAPEITITYPNGGEVWPTNTLETIQWSANDADGDPLTYAVRYRSAPDAPWRILTAGLADNFYTINTAALAGGSQASIQVLATDGIRTSVDTTDGTFSVADQVPRVYILSPEPEQIIDPFASSLLVGYAFDPEDGIIDGDFLCWTLENGPELGCGSQLTTNFSAGHYTLILTATDSDDNQVSASLDIQVGFTANLPIMRR